MDKGKNVERADDTAFRRLQDLKQLHDNQTTLQSHVTQILSLTRALDHTDTLLAELSGAAHTLKRERTLLLSHLASITSDLTTIASRTTALQDAQIKRRAELDALRRDVYEPLREVVEAGRAEFGMEALEGVEKVVEREAATILEERRKKWRDVGVGGEGVFVEGDVPALEGGVGSLTSTARDAGWTTSGEPSSHSRKRRISSQTAAAVQSPTDTAHFTSTPNRKYGARLGRPPSTSSSTSRPASASTTPSTPHPPTKRLKLRTGSASLPSSPTSASRRVTLSASSEVMPEGEPVVKKRRGRPPKS
ncbi:uncharacterized protein EV422DRAFT_340800 [Fimicolochytrium jonesii]|uniref:uncharacterized protein n=1 Tax=Fimicolochytrium jonesii TaxID=1396493 RepID=UPI0022FEFB73|nr:uncharacterized protein EV422DRAFT_340800 [Fimicolochytrium jonesii]KAI8815805.1 hypothetical protein EV422DRAFT_340800 [Fimicolochytrium jonesii]